MPTSVTMPALGESVSEGTVTRWLKQEGDQVQADEPLLEVSTDKVDTEIPSPASGVLTKIVVAEDETVAVGAELAVIGGDSDGAGDSGSSDGADDAAQQEQPAETEQPAEQQQDEQEDQQPAEQQQDEQEGQQQAGQEDQTPQSGGGSGGGTSVTMPALGESVTEGTVTRWLKQEGDQVQTDEPLLEVSTDKVDTEIPSPASGVLTKIVVAEDETVAVGAELAVIGGGSDGAGDSGSSDGADDAAQQEQPAETEQPAEQQQDEPEGQRQDAQQGQDTKEPTASLISAPSPSSRPPSRRPPSSRRPPRRPSSRLRRGSPAVPRPAATRPT